MSIFTRALRAGEGKILGQLQAFSEEVKAQEPAVQKLTDSQLQMKTDEFRSRLAAGETLDDIAVEAFAAMREAAVRVLGMRPFDVQVMGGVALHRGMVIEMRTGEGKTLVSTMPAYLNALGGDGVHVVTTNDYLAARDSEWMGQVHRFMGLTVGLIQADMDPPARKIAYAADITNGTNNEFGFDYLRDNMAMSADQMTKRGHRFAIIDEVDSILVDEARTPLIISGVVGDAAKWYRDFAKIARGLSADVHYEVDEKKRQVITTEEGVSRVEQILGIENMYDHAAVDFVHHLDVALKAEALYAKDVEYLLNDGEVKIVDEFTGRVLDGRRYSEGLHQAIEAKEGVQVKQENQTLATITLQNYFRMYEKLSGMTGTAQTEAAEFKEIYDLEVVQLPTNRPIARADQEDFIYKSEAGKFAAVTADVTERHAKGQPVLIGTVSIETSEALSRALRKAGVTHEVLNAKHHQREAEIIAQAGRKGAVTVATNMAGRGVDIKLGGDAEGLAHSAARQSGFMVGSPEFEAKRTAALVDFQTKCDRERQPVLAAGGLYVLGTERHDSRRIDNQLRGRSGRQGDPGESRFFLSTEDDLIRRFSGERVHSIMERLRMPEDEAIENKMISKAVERAQSAVESQNFEIRKNVLKYDEVMNKQREIIYSWRSGILLGGQAEELAQSWIDEVVENVVLSVVGENTPAETWDWDELLKELNVIYPTRLGEGPVTTDALVDEAISDAHQQYEEREEEFTPEVLRQLEKRIALSMIDNKWRDHLGEMDYLRAGINLRAMGQRDPLVEYQNEGYDAFSGAIESVKEDAVRYLFHVQMVRPETAVSQIKVQKGAASGGGPTAAKKPVRVSDKVGRNEECPCGSGKKYKKCHGAN